MTTTSNSVPPDIELRGLLMPDVEGAPATFPPGRLDNQMQAEPGLDRGTNVLAARVAAFVAADAGIADDDQLEELRGMFGRDAFAKLLLKFGKDLYRRLDTIKAGASRADVGSNAHAMISSAGSLGFGTFSDLCRSIEQVADGNGDLAPCIAAFIAASGHVLLKIESLAGPTQS